MSLPAIAFKANNKDGRYLCDGVDCGDWDDEYLDTKVLTDALLIIRNDNTAPDETDIEDFYELFALMPMSNDVQFIKDNYTPVPVVLTPEEVKIVRERNEW